MTRFVELNTKLNTRLNMTTNVRQSMTLNVKHSMRLCMKKYVMSLSQMNTAPHLPQL